MAYIESNIKLNFPDSNHFRFQDIEAYKELSGYSFKEMDACWYDTEANVFYMIELKDYTEGNIGERENRLQRTYNLVKKSVDSLCMLLAMFAETKHGKKFIDELPFNIARDCQVVLVSIVNISQEQKEYLGFIRDDYRSKFESYRRLFDLKAVILSRDSAVERFIWVEMP